MSTEWRALVLEQMDDPASWPGELSGGGELKLAGSPAAVTAAVEAAAEAADRGVLHLDLEGWEPEAEDLEGFARFRAALSGLEGVESKAELGALARGQGVFQAALLRLASQLPEPAPLPAELDRETFVATLAAWSAARPRVVVVADAEMTPAPLRRALSAAADRAGGSLGVVLGEARPGPRRVEPRGGDSGGDFDRRLESLRAPLRGLLEDLVLADAALPLEVLAERLEPDAARREDLIDQVDDLLVDELGWVADLGFTHPAFEQAVYRVTDPLAAWRLRHSIDDAPRRAARLLEHLRLRLAPRSRVTSCFLLQLSRFAGETASRRRLAARLAWWLPTDELEGELRAAEDLEDEVLESLGGDGVLKPAARLAALEARESRGVPEDDAFGRHLLMRARAQSDLGETHDALEDAGRALEWGQEHHGPNSEAVLAARVTQARLLADLGERVEARDELIACRRLARDVLAEDDPRHVTLATDLAEVLIALGELRRARAPLEEAVSLSLAQNGADHPQVVTRRNNLAALLIDIGELEAARGELQTALDAAEKGRLPPPLRLGLLHNLQMIALRLDEGEIEATEAKLAASVELLGEEHPELVALLGQLAELLTRRGETERASRVLLRAVDLAEAQGEPHPLLPRLEEQLEALQEPRQT